MPKLLNDAIQIGIAVKNDHAIHLPFLFEEPTSHAIFDMQGYGYQAEQYIYDKQTLTIYKETMCTWTITTGFLLGSHTRYAPSEIILAAWITDTQKKAVQHTFYNTRLLNPKTYQGCKSKTARALGFDNCTTFKKEYNPKTIKPITITNATT